MVGELGSGSSATVKLCTRRSSRDGGGFGSRNREEQEDKEIDCFAIKIFDRRQLARAGRQDTFRRRLPGSTVPSPKPSSALTKVHSEMTMLSQLSHQNVVRLEEVIDAPDHGYLYMVMQHAGHGPLMEYDEETGRFAAPTTGGVYDTTQAAELFRGMLMGLQHLHQHGIAHRDIKPGNVLVTLSGRAVLADLGVAHQFTDGNELLRETEGTWCFWSPEMCQLGTADGKGGSFNAMGADVWAAGITLYAMLAGVVPFIGSSSVELFEAILSDNLPMVSSWEHSLCDLVTRLLCKAPDARITIDNALEHPWLTSDDSQSNGRVRSLLKNMRRGSSSFLHSLGSNRKKSGAVTDGPLDDTGMTTAPPSPSPEIRYGRQGSHNSHNSKMSLDRWSSKVSPTRAMYKDASPKAVGATRRRRGSSDGPSCRVS
ncbi:unnamed protein product [Chrysoparadoxa australica]